MCGDGGDGVSGGVVEDDVEVAMETVAAEAEEEEEEVGEDEE
jgi:hypothetical protein